MRSGSNNLDYFHKNQLNQCDAVYTCAYVLSGKLENGGWVPCPLVYATELSIESSVLYSIKADFMN